MKIDEKIKKFLVEAKAPDFLKNPKTPDDKKVLQIIKQAYEDGWDEGVESFKEYIPSDCEIDGNVFYMKNQKKNGLYEFTRYWGLKI